MRERIGLFMLGHAMTLTFVALVGAIMRAVS
jgi:hypothetical protein